MSKALREVTAGAREATFELVSATIHQGKLRGWRPVWAAAKYALASMEATEHMSPAEFEAWRLAQRNGKMKGRRADGPPENRLGIGQPTALRMARGDIKVSRVVALACAHVSMRLPLPIQPNEDGEFDGGEFGDWFYPRFGRPPTGISQWLELTPDYINERVRGFAIRDDKRQSRSPDEGLIRALDWIDRMGPVNPYGSKVEVKAHD